MGFLDILGILAGLFTSSSIIPQITKTIKRKKANDVSIFMFVVLSTGNALWIYYGAEKSDMPIIATNLLALGLNVVMMVLKFRFREKENAGTGYKYDNNAGGNIW
ncbi:SemiSWEET family sugar transporter [Parapedobacter deserti]|uniref:SemiSWEET family sugar transporter n=1 Tax=Parapedobacter deserti TaxID=1912957 RepID=A0ABV7JXM1_9SPHI